MAMLRCSINRMAPHSPVDRLLRDRGGGLRKSPTKEFDMANQVTITSKIVPDLEVVQTRLNAGLAKAQEFTDRFTVYSRDNIEAAVQGGRIWADGTQKISNRVIFAIQSLARES